MIKMSDLKPILEPLCTEDNAADVIAAVQAIDTVTVDSEVEAAVAAANAEWNRKFKETFFGGAKEEPEADPEPEEEEINEEATLEDLMNPED